MSNEAIQKSGKMRAALSLTAVLMISLGSAGTSALTPIMAKLIEAFPDVPQSTVYLVSTLPSLICLISAMLIGPFVGRRVRYKTVSIIGTVCCIIGGVGPFFFATSSIVMILFLRVVFGFGMGFMNFYNAIIIAEYEGEARAKYLGWAVVVNKIGAIIMLQLSGFLADMRWNYAFWAYALLFVTLVKELLFMKEPDTSQAGNEEKGAEKKEPIKIGKAGIFWTVAWLVLLLLHYPAPLTLSQIVVDKAIGGGSATVAATLNSIYQVGGMVVSAIFSVLFFRLKKYTFPVLMFICCAGIALMLYGPGTFLSTAVSEFAMGVAFTGCGVLVNYFLGSDTPANSMPTLLSVFNIAVRLAIVVCGYYISFIGAVTGDSLYGSWYVCLAFYLVFAVVTLFVDSRPKPVREEQAKQASAEA